MSKLSDIIALKERLDVFLPRLRQRVEEVGADSKKEAADLYAAGTDHESQMNYQSFVTTVTQQINQVATKAERTFQEHFARFEDVDDDAVEAIYNECESKVDLFTDWVEDFSEHLFNETAGLEAERNYNKAVADFKEAAAKFTCSQCGAPVPVTEMYYTSQYLTCLGCGTQSNFQPSTDMQALPVYAEDLARARTADQRVKTDAMYQQELPVGELAAAVVDLDIREFNELNNLLPVYGAQRLGIYKEGIYSSIFHKNVMDIEPAGYRSEDLAYVNYVSLMADTLRDMRATGHPQAVLLAEEAIKMVARPGDALAQAALDGTLDNALWQRCAAEAEARPLNPNPPL